MRGALRRGRTKRYITLHYVCGLSWSSTYYFSKVYASQDVSVSILGHKQHLHSNLVMH